ncbi:flagellar hook-associated protein 3 [Cohnella endophytica]|uniref:Flagellar hook-associated protein 3 n=2 Tax=Cohnella endophytica TaxID=2419778 RepID=A0A494XCM6_9BACL|nr:flagellar hook-associated protein 3 [Cohnella endophytica]
MLRNINTNLHKLDNYQNMESTGRKINKPSDDPVGITYALRYRSEIAMNEQYQKNMDTAQASLQHVDTVLGQVGELINRVKEITVQGLNGTNSPTALSAIGQEISQLYNHLVSLGNDQLNGKYIFNGQFTDKQPYTVANAGTEQTDTESIDYKFAAGVTVAVNITGDEVFGVATGSPGDTGDNLFSVFKGLANAFNSNDPNAATPLLESLNSRADKLLNARADIGARTNRLEFIDNRIKDLDLNLNELSGKTEDADITDVIMKLNMSQNVYQASLSVGAKVIQPSLLDFLR